MDLQQDAIRKAEKGAKKLLPYAVKAAKLAEEILKEEKSSLLQKLNTKAEEAKERDSRKAERKPQERGK